VSMSEFIRFITLKGKLIIKWTQEYKQN
jgi:hypothetical protein